ncbi:hypothetical protein BC834DRAFT_844752 [Gloeopeniophorella convolvens]|nr:hypothetical protein BC834DRAFT_844752 [Gloeopeniophorella convolvens]
MPVKSTLRKSKVQAGLGSISASRRRRTHVSGSTRKTSRPQTSWRAPRPRRAQGYCAARAARRLLGLTGRALMSAVAEEEDADEPAWKAPGKKVKAAETKEDARERTRGRAVDKGMLVDKGKSKAKRKKNQVVLEEENAPDEEVRDPFVDGEV